MYSTVRPFSGCTGRSFAPSTRDRATASERVNGRGCRATNQSAPSVHGGWMHVYIVCVSEKRLFYSCEFASDLLVFFFVVLARSGKVCVCGSAFVMYV
jgi:hypothetical protein